MKAIPYLNLALTAILVCSIAFALLRGFNAEVDAYATSRMHKAERARDSAMKEVEKWRIQARELTNKADSIAAALDSAKARQETSEQTRRKYAQRMRYAPIKDVLDTLAAE